MSRVKAVMGTMALCALVLGVFGVANASAAGLTAVTCTSEGISPGKGHFATNHCETPQVAEGNFETVPVPAGTHVTGEAVGTSILTGKLLTIEVEITCKAMHSTGEVTNIEEGGEMKAHGTNTVLHYTECSAHLKGKTEAEEACEIENLTGNNNKGTINTDSLTALSGAEHKVTIKPSTGTVFSEFKVLSSGTNCHIPTTTTKVEGEVIGIANTEKHSHLTLEAATNGTALRAFGNVAHYIGTNVGYMEEAGGTPGNTVGLTTF